MAKIIMKNWQEGMEKVSLSKLQNDLLRLPLKESKANVDRLLDNKTVEIEVDDISVAKEFIKRANQIGAICYLEENSSLSS